MGGIKKKDEFKTNIPCSLVVKIRKTSLFKVAGKNFEWHTYLIKKCWSNQKFYFAEWPRKFKKKKIIIYLFFLPELCKQIIAGENCEKVGYIDMSIPSLLGL